MSRWRSTRAQWTFKNLETGNLVGSRAGGPILARTRREARALAKLNGMRGGDYKIIRVRLAFEEMAPGEAV